jgi:hypothetical protein
MSPSERVYDNRNGYYYVAEGATLDNYGVSLVIGSGGI